jgi:hypothetical protein
MSCEPGWPDLPSTRIDGEVVKIYPMAKVSKTVPWINLTNGLVWLFIALRAIYWPRLPSFSHMSIAHRRSLVPLELTVALIWLACAYRGFSQARRNPEGKVEPAFTTIFGPQ